MKKEKIEELIHLAFEAQKRAYVPYSHFRVGAALLAKNGTVYQGCNIENAAFTPTICAERTAFAKAISEGEKKFEAIAIVGNKEEIADGQGDYCAPCGVCRQVMQEFCNPKEFMIILAVSCEEYKIYTLQDLLPLGFDSGNLE